MKPNLLNQPLRLPNGTVLRNRLAKAAMSETLGTYDNRPTPDLVQLYRRWAGSGVASCASAPLAEGSAWSSADGSAPSPVAGSAASASATGSPAESRNMSRRAAAGAFSR